MQLQIMNNDKYDHENQVKYKRVKIQKLELESLKYTCQLELFEHDKEVVFTINNIINSYNYIDNHIDTLDRNFSTNLELNNKLSPKKKIKIAFNNDSTPLLDVKDRKILKKYNGEQFLNEPKSSTVINNLNNIKVFESSEFLKGKFKNNSSDYL